MIKKLDNSNEEVANQIFAIFQSSYKIEAQLIEAVNFPPLLRSAKDIEHTKALFFSFSINELIVAVIETVLADKRLNINSLTVDPNYFRRGIADKLISYMLNTIDFSEAVVETAVANIPATNLYKKHGFVEYKRWTPSHGIEKLAMSLNRSYNSH